MTKITTITITTVHGRMQVEAHAVLGVWAVHRPWQNEHAGWNVSHTPSGLRAITCANLATAMIVLTAMPQTERVSKASVSAFGNAILALGLDPGCYGASLPMKERAAL